MSIRVSFREDTCNRFGGHNCFHCSLTETNLKLSPYSNLRVTYSITNVSRAYRFSFLGYYSFSTSSSSSDDDDDPTHSQKALNNYITWLQGTHYLAPNYITSAPIQILLHIPEKLCCGNLLGSRHVWLVDIDDRNASSYIASKTNHRCSI